MGQTWEYVQAGFVFGPIAGLLILGLVISLKSGVVDLASAKGLRVIASNFSWLLLRMAGILVGLLAVERLIGVRADLGW